MKRFLVRFSGSPETLAAFRIAVSVALLFSTELHRAPRFARLSPALRMPPEGLGWFFALVPANEPVARAALAVALFGAIATMLGLYTQLATAVLLAASFYLLALGQLSGTVVHDMHLVWFAAILAASPCGEAWSVDAWLRKAPRARRDPADYAIAVWTARVIFACIYFFPGFWKLATQGIGWALSDNLAYQLYWKWFEWGSVPGFRLDQHPRLLAAGGAAVLAFEVGFPGLLATTRTRLVAAIVGLGFHLATEKLFRIPFSSLWLCYPVLLDFRARQGADDGAAIALLAHGTRRRLPRRTGFELFVCVALIAGAVVQGVRGKTDAFPFACYPTFQHHPPREIADLRIVGVAADGATFDIPHARDAHGIRSQTRWGQVWALAGITQPASESRLFEYTLAVFAANPGAFATAERVEARRSFTSVVPGALAAGTPATADALLATFPVERLREASVRLPRSRH